MLEKHRFAQRRFRGKDAHRRSQSRFTGTEICLKERVSGTNIPTPTKIASGLLVFEPHIQLTLHAGRMRLGSHVQLIHVRTTVRQPATQPCERYPRLSGKITVMAYDDFLEPINERGRRI